MTIDHSHTTDVEPVAKQPMKSKDRLLKNSIVRVQASSAISRYSNFLLLMVVVFLSLIVASRQAARANHFTMFPRTKTAPGGPARGEIVR